MRLYLIVNRYSIGIQAGIQAMHAIPEMYEKYRSEEIEDSKISDWANDHKTVMVLRTMGGHDSIEDLYHSLLHPARRERLPISIFHEGALRGSATALAILLPEEYYETPKEFLTGSMREIYDLIGGLPFAA